MNHDFDLGSLMAESVQDVTAPVPAIVLESNRLGRRRQFHRRLRIGATAATVAVLAFGGAALGTPYFRDGSAPVASAAASPSGPVGTSPSGPLGTELPTAQLTPEAMLKILADSLPAGTKLQRFERTSREVDADHVVGVKVQYDDGRGTATLTVVLDRAGEQPGGCTRPSVQYQTCVDQTLADGSVESFSSAWRTPPAVETVSVRRPGGDRLVVSNMNGVIPEVGTARDRDAPALDEWLLKAIAESPAWQFKVAQTVVDAGAKLAETVPQGMIIDAE
ncbi:hypothetical protein ACGFX4_11240 [Kitasatospora sp. NPDC048365]|uniref:hypothetical protein n=1 Tax=Kitasatospora sp. NPDC048365 TaxID=3364050 RepID=UPI00371ED7F4